ncbi:MAG: 2-oxoacid:acceptor oxidoreductase subunit alpha [Nitrososphaeria archaeon]|nr:2-oxoacid:acceptor oxidoreductase subunit alpha [Nitrososphaeria archaeon]NIN53542.1 2-oxoacid:acceptor oxidoreductase subunit alpha [Nitrososphaeria archaeon]NIQ34061.1 2-oxoacid:acceptor oxidoreductase subunit alpha [Nitrososphaeria archaeon]
MGKKQLMMGDHACAEGALMAGCRYFAGYPITPASEIVEWMSRRMPEEDGVFIQMEDELASICSVIGASYTGVKAMTATSGPGFSLMQEGIGTAFASEIPCVIVDVQRIGPGSGGIMSMQGDVMQARWGTHGNVHEAIALSPSSPQDMFDFTIDAFNLSEEYRLPVIVLSETAVGRLSETVEIPDPEDIKIVNRKKPTVSPEEFILLEAPEDSAPPMPSFGEGYRIFHTTHTRTLQGRPVLSLIKYPLTEAVRKRLTNKIRLNLDKITRLETEFIDDADVITLAYGLSARAARRAVLQAREMGIKAGYLRPITIWPFHYERVGEIFEEAKAIVVAEVNTGQIFYEVKASVGKDKNVVLCPKLVDTHSPDEILMKIKEVA